MAAGRTAVLVLLLSVVMGGESGAAPELRPATNRPDVVEVGAPQMISREVLRREMDRNTDLREYVRAYGWPEYAEVQEVVVQEPFAAYEVRLYYLHRNQFLVFGRVNVAPSVSDYGVRKYEGPIDPETLDRLLTAEPAPLEEPLAKAQIVAPAAAAESEETTIEPEAEAPPAPVTVAAGEGIEAAVQRLEAAADRAATAADAAETASAAAQISADRATNALERVIRSAEQ